jgi:predicted nucleic acid-binding protein
MPRHRKRRVSRTSSSDDPPADYILNTRPILNFLGIGRIDLLAQLTGKPPLVSPTVLVEVREHIRWTVRDLERRTRREPSTVEPEEVGYVAILEEHEAGLRSPHVRLLHELQLEELETVSGILKTGRLDPGEAEVLAIAKQRGYIAVIDELAGHRWAETEGIRNESTLTLLVEAVRQKWVDERTASAVWTEIQRWWDYAPLLPFSDYLHGAPAWPPSE